MARERFVGAAPVLKERGAAPTAIQEEKPLTRNPARLPTLSRRLINLGCTGRDVLSTGARSLLPYQCGKTTLTSTRKASFQDLFQKTGSAKTTWLSVLTVFTWLLLHISNLIMGNAHLSLQSIGVQLSQDTPSNADATTQLPSFEDVCLLHCSTIRHIPIKSRPAFAGAAFHSILHENSEEAWLKFFMLPKCVLVAPKRRECHHKPLPINHLCDLWSKGQFGFLWEHASQQVTSRTCQTHTSGSDHNIRLAIGLAKEGLYGKACQILSHQGLHLIMIPPGSFCRQNTLRAQLQRLVGKCLCQITKGKALDYFSPHQFGVACPSGAEKIVHGLRSSMEDHQNEQDFVVMKIDLRNAFNLVSRQALLDECSAHFPELLQWAAWCYGQHPLLWSPIGTIMSDSGVQQGDPLGPLLFCLVLQKVLSAIASDPICFDLLFHAWYIDDGIIAGSKQAIVQALSIIQDLGPPLGDTIFCAKFIAEKRAGASNFLALLKEVGSLDSQVALVLLRQCGAWQQAQLCLSRGGLGLRSLSQHSAAAYVASFAVSGSATNTSHHLLQSIDCLNSLVSPADVTSTDELLTSPKYQKELSSRIEHRFGMFCFESCRQAGIGGQMEVGSGLGHDARRKRPADVLVPNWVLGKPAAFDITVTSPLTPITLHEASVTSGSTAQVAENRKHASNDAKCSELGWVCVPLAVEAYGCWGPEAQTNLS
ncbi:hypothetical protein EMCRGX_G009650 [Ephydatia muelleri]